MPLRFCHKCKATYPIGQRHDCRRSHGTPRPWAERKRYEAIARSKGLSCVYCGSQATTADHVDGNRHNKHPDNIVPCCGSCNAAKGTRTAEEYMRTVTETPPTGPPTGPEQPAPSPSPPSPPPPTLGA